MKLGWYWVKIKISWVIKVYNRESQAVQWNKVEEKDRSNLNIKERLYRGGPRSSNRVLTKDQVLRHLN